MTPSVQKFRVNSRRSDFDSISDLTVDALGKLAIAFKILALFDKIGFLINPIDIIFQSFVAAEKIAEFGKATEEMNEAANLADVMLDAASDISPLNFDGDNFAGF